MTEQEAIAFIRNAMKLSQNALAELMLVMPKIFKQRAEVLGEYYGNLENCKKEIQSCEVAIAALEEIQQYREIGTVEECVENKAIAEELSAIEIAEIYVMLEKLKQYQEIGTVEEIERMKRYQKLAKAHGTIGQVIEECVKYEAIGNVEECREAVEKQVPKIPNTYGDGYDDEGNLIYDMYECPNCGKSYEIDYDRYDYCPECGQKIDWSKEDE